MHNIFTITAAAIVTLLFLFPPGVLRAEIKEPSAGRNDTLLMFVGEDLDVLSIASRRQESAGQAPAVARVITREEIRERGIRTLSHALEMEPGFYLAKKEWGSQPYLRGIPDSVLFLYDTVPTGSDISKSLHPLDHELSLAPIKRIEILRGPGSVLWGPDAFAGHRQYGADDREGPRRGGNGCSVRQQGRSAGLLRERGARCGPMGRLFVGERPRRKGR